MEESETTGATVTGNVAVLIDFENLIRGLEYMNNAEVEVFDSEPIFRLAEEFGNVVLSNAYADWRFSAYNRFQVELFRNGLDLIPVLGNQHKNAVDVKMAVDAMEILWTHSHIQTFVIVSGDRDFIHCLKAIRKYGKTLVGVSPSRTVSPEFAGLCDRFVRYDMLLRNMGSGASGNQNHVSHNSTEMHEQDLSEMKQALVEILSQRPDGIKGAQVKPLLRRKLNFSFDESNFGFPSLTALLRAFPDVVQVVPDPSGGDVTVVARNASTPEYSPQTQHQREYPTLNRLIYQAGLLNYRYTRDAGLRRDILDAFYDAIQRKEPFTLNELFASILEANRDLDLTTTILAKYQSILWQSRAFRLEPNPEGRATRDRPMWLNEEIRTADDLIYRYELSVVLKVNIAAQQLGMELTAEMAADILGLDSVEESVRYGEMLLHEVRTRVWDQPEGM